MGKDIWSKYQGYTQTVHQIQFYSRWLSMFAVCYLLSELTNYGVRTFSAL